MLRDSAKDKLNLKLIRKPTGFLFSCLLLETKTVEMKKYKMKHDVLKSVRVLLFEQGKSRVVSRITIDYCSSNRTHKKND